MSGTDDDEALESYGANIGEQRASWRHYWEWILVRGDRLSIAAIISVGTFLGLLLLYILDLVAFINDDSITRLAGGMIAGTFSLVTLVVSINQLILSREFTAAAESKDQLEGVLSFRSDVADHAAVPAAPASPSRVLELIALGVRDRANRLAEAVSDQDARIREAVIPYTNSVQQETDRIGTELKHTEFGTFRTVSAAIGYDEAWHLYGARHLRAKHGEQFSEEATDAIDELIAGLQLFDVGREHLKTTYLQRELTRFSQLTIYSGVPAVLAAIFLGLMYADVAGPTIRPALLPFVTSALITIVVFPLALLGSYIIRTATITRRTASIGPMLPQKDPSQGPFEVTYGEEAGGRSIESGSEE